MATGILLKRPPAQKRPFQPPTYGINRLPPPEPLDPEKFVGLGLDLSTRAREHTSKACGLFRRLDEFARLNRDRLSNEDVVNALTDLREQAEVELERGFYAFDVATEVLTRIGRHEPSFGEIITRKDSERWKSYFHSLRGVLARAYKGMYEMILATPTCGDLSHIPPQLHFSDPALVMKRRYDRRLGLAVVAGHDEGKEYWRRRLVKGVESGALPGQVVLQDERTEPVRRRKGGREAREDPGAESLGRRAPGEYVEGTTTYYRVDDHSLELATDDNPEASGGHAKAGQSQEAETGPMEAAAQEPYISNLMFLVNASSSSGASHENPASADEVQGALAKLSQAGEVPGTGRRSSRLQERRESASGAQNAPNAPAPAPRQSAGLTRAPTRATKKRKRAPAGKGGKGDGPAAKRQRRSSVVFVAKEGQDMSPLSYTELAQLPWNIGLSASSRVDPRKWVPSFPGRRSQGIDMFPHLMAWARYEDPAVYQGVEPRDEPVNTSVPTRMDDTMGVDMEDTLDMEDDMNEGVGNMEDDKKMDRGGTRLSDILEDNEDSSDNESLRNQSRRTSPAPTQPVDETTRDPSLSIASPAGDRSQTSLKITTSEFLGGDTTRFQSSPPDGRSRTVSGDTSKVLGKPFDMPPPSKPAERTPKRQESFDRFKGSSGGDQPTVIGPLRSGVSGLDPSIHAGVEPGHPWCSVGTPTEPVREEPTLPKLPEPKAPTEPARSTKGLQNRVPYSSGLWTSSDPPEGAAPEAQKPSPQKPPIGAPTEEETQEKSNEPQKNNTDESQKHSNVESQEHSNVSDEAEETHQEAGPTLKEVSPADDASDGAPTEPSTGASRTPVPSESSLEEDGTTLHHFPKTQNKAADGTTTLYHSPKIQNKATSRKPLGNVYSNTKGESEAGPSEPKKKPISPPSGSSRGDSPDPAIRKAQEEFDAEMAARLAQENAQATGLSQSDMEDAIKASLIAEARSASAQVQAENDDALSRARGTHTSTESEAARAERKAEKARRKAERKALKKAQRKAEKKAQKEKEEEITGESEAPKKDGSDIEMTDSPEERPKADSDIEMTDSPEERAKADSDVEMTNAPSPPAEGGGTVITDTEWAVRSNVQPRAEVYNGWNERGEPVQEKQWTI